MTAVSVSHESTHEDTRRPVLRRTIRILHVLWAIPCVVASVLLAGADGHPPGLIFVPVVVALWILGHLTLLLSRVVAERSATGHSIQDQWPISIIAAVAALGVASFAGLFAMAWPFLGGAGISESMFWAITVGWLLHSASFVGLLARRKWARFTAAGVALLWTVILAAQMWDHLRHGRSFDPTQTSVALAAVAILLLLAFRLCRGKGEMGYIERG